MYNKIYEFNSQVFGESIRMVMTSVSGHLLNYEFVGKYKNWHSCNPLELFYAPIQKMCPTDSQKIKVIITAKFNDWKYRFDFNVIENTRKGNR